MTELTEEYVASLMNNVPPQEDVQKAITILESEPGSVTYEIDVPTSQTNYHGAIHGGFISTMLESAAGMATYAYGLNNVVVSCSTNFIRAVGPQKLTVSAWTSHKGRSTSVCHCDIHDAQGKLIAEATYTMFILGPLSEC